MSGDDTVVDLAALIEWADEITPECSCESVHTEPVEAVWMVRDPRTCHHNGGWTPVCGRCMVAIRRRCDKSARCAECRESASRDVNAKVIRGFDEGAQT